MEENGDAGTPHTHDDSEVGTPHVEEHTDTCSDDAPGGRVVQQNVVRGYTRVASTIQRMMESAVLVLGLSDFTLTIPDADLMGYHTFFITVEVRVRKARVCCHRWHTKSKSRSMEVVPSERDGGRVLASCAVGFKFWIPQSGLSAGGVSLRLHLCAERKTGRRKVGRNTHGKWLATFSQSVPSSISASEEELQLAFEHCHHLSGRHVYKAHANVNVTKKSEAFVVERCWPTTYPWLWHDEWEPTTPEQWSTAWGHQKMLDGDAGSGVDFMTEEMKCALVLVYQTLFPRTPGEDMLRWMDASAEAKEDYDRRVLFVKRLYLCASVGRVTFSIQENAPIGQPWRFPLASVFCHGGRLLLRLDGVRWEDVLNFLLCGDPAAHNWEKDGVPSPIKARWAATHSITLDRLTTRLYERRLTAVDVHRNLADGLWHHHLGLDVPIGGLGNPAPQMQKTKAGRFFIGPSGVPFTSKQPWVGKRLSRKQAKSCKPLFHDKMQHGHFYIRWNDFGVMTVPMLHPSAGTEAIDSACSNLRKDAYSHEDRWLQMPRPHDAEHLQMELRSHGYHALADSEGGSLRDMYEHIALTQELVLERSQENVLRLQCVLLYISVEMERAGTDCVLIQREAVARSSANEAAYIEDVRVPTLIRRQFQAWEDAMRSFCRDSFGLGPEACDAAVEHCRNAEEDINIHRVSRPSSLCHMHQVYDGEIEVEYDAYQFSLHVRNGDEELFSPIAQHDEFETCTGGHQLRGFGTCQPGLGSITRKWAWVTKDEAKRLGAAGMHSSQTTGRTVRETDHVCALLLGLESSAPHKKSLFGHSHTMAAEKQSLSAFGKHKWEGYRKYGCEVPADYGAIRATLDATGFKFLQHLCGELSLSRPSSEPELAQAKERDFFKDILQASEDQADEVYSRHGFARPSATGNMDIGALDEYVRNRVIASPTVDESVKAEAMEMTP
mmetsp:Transcript_74565/g.207207  ORF Transcript_74565/g.207207 Transcript_74565/m.207207 type:complete len:948 (-) Transcript_74565:149-2992(-)